MNICTVDIESTLIPPEGSLYIDKIFCIGVKSNDEPTKIFTYVYNKESAGNLKGALAFINKHDICVGHNFAKFDKPVIENLIGKITIPIADTLIDSKLMFTKNQLIDIDLSSTTFPKQLIGSYSLKAFGYRLGGELKIEFEQFDKLTSEMMTYCARDVDVTYELYKFLIAQSNYPPDNVRHLEYRVAEIINEQENLGFYFDIEKARMLSTNMKFKKMNLEHKLQAIFSPKYLAKGNPIVPANSRKNRDYAEDSDYKFKSRPPLRFIHQLPRYKDGRYRLPGKAKFKWFDVPHKLLYVYTLGEYQPIVLTKFNPGSRQHIIRELKDKYKWEPAVFTKSGEPQVDADTLVGLPYEEALPLKQYLKLVKDLGQLSETPNSLIQTYLQSTGAIHGSVDTLGAVTRRAAHYGPNLGQVPKKDPAKGQDGEFRKLFTVPEGWVFVGSDASALELKILAHYLYPYDNGAYDHAIDKGDKSNGTDVHSMAQKAMGLPTRDAAKTATYGILYGSSGPRVGWGLLADSPDTKVEYTKSEFNTTKDRLLKRAKAIDGVQYFPISKAKFIPLTDRLVEMAIYGYRVIDGFKSNLKGFAEMVKDLEASMVGDYLPAVDKGLLPVRSKHSLLNLALQSAGSIAVKYWMVEVHKQLQLAGYVSGRDYVQMGYIHDELDFRVVEGLEHKIGPIISNAMKAVKEQLNLNVDLEAEYMVGLSWYHCH